MSDQEAGSTSNQDILKQAITTMSETNKGLLGILEGQAKKQKNEERWTRVKVLLFSIPVTFFAAIYGIWIASTVQQSTKDHIAVVRLDGAISGDSKASAQKLIAPLRAAFSSKYSKAVVLEINSPGGSPSQAIAVYDEIKALRKENPSKKIYAVGEDAMASAAYLIAVATDEIWVQPTTITGSIGVIWEGFGFDPKVVEKWGVEHRLYTAGEHKARFSPFAPLTENDKAKMKGILSSTAEMFYGYVKVERGDKLPKDKDLFTGDWWLGAEAVPLGLADKIGGTEVMARSEYPEIKSRKYYSTGGWQDYLSGITGQVSDVFFAKAQGGFR